MTASIDNVSVREIDPLAVSIQMDGRMNVTDAASENTNLFDWAESPEIMQLTVETNNGTPRFLWRKSDGTTNQAVRTANGSVSVGLFSEFNAAARATTTDAQVAISGTASANSDTGTAFVPAVNNDLPLFKATLPGEYTIRTFRMWDSDLGDTGIEEASS